MDFVTPDDGVWSSDSACLVVTFPVGSYTAGLRLRATSDKIQAFRIVPASGVRWKLTYLLGVHLGGGNQVSWCLLGSAKEFHADGDALRHSAWKIRPPSRRRCSPFSVSLHSWHTD